MWIGSQGNTKQEIARALTLPEYVFEYDILKATSDLSNGLTNSSNIDVSFANRVYILKNLKVGWKFSHILRNFLGSDLIGVGFNKLCLTLFTQLPNNVHYETSRMEVNKWVEEQTHGMIRELLPTGSINEETRMIAVNALYFKGVWKEQFSDSETYEAPFHRLDGTTQKMQMMYLKHRFAFHKFRNLDAQAIRIPFSDSLWEMVIVLPYERDGLPQLLEHSRRPGVLRSIISGSYRSEEISLRLPRFTLGLAESVNGKVILNTMGIWDLFNPRTADLSGIARDEPLVVSNVFHKAVLKVSQSTNDPVHES
ncbi:hypothetical protein AHF37_12808 [Paragonimus kellicotti]|nr:hypothetical protein AHF37_12808 [Paragonimus kellicotti]